jgi:SNF2 family DNA or RNA helicase
LTFARTRLYKTRLYALVIPSTLAIPLVPATLQPSVHARGARPYVYHGQLDEWHAPGAQVGRGETRCAVDCAWLAERVLGAPKKLPPKWPGVPMARERAIEFGARVGARHYQQEGGAFLAERDYGVLTDAMGIGKTMEALVAAEARLSLASVSRPDVPLVLVLCPALAKRHWEREILRWTGYEAAVLDGLRPDFLPFRRYVIANYDILYGAQRSDSAGKLHAAAHLPGWASMLAGKFLIAILDEGHLLRGRDSRRTKAVKAVCNRIPVVWALTGTPAPNYIRDLWSLVDLVSGGLFGASYWKWAQKYTGAHQAQYGWKDTGSDNLDELSPRLSYFMFGRSKEHVGLELPERTVETYKIDVEVTAPSVHEAREAMTKSGFVAAALRKTAKAKRPAVVAQAVEALEAKQKVIVFVYMREQCEAIAKDLKRKVDCSVMCVHGDLSPEGRDKQAQVFREASSPAAFVATIDSVGLAISLVGADLMLFGDLVPEPHKLLQAMARAHRFGSTTRLLIRFLVATGTLDEDVEASVLSKLATIEQALGPQAEQQELQGLLGGRSSEQIVDELFEKLKARAAT